MNRLEEEIHALAGEPFNIASPKQVGEVLFEKLKISEKPKKTKTGQYVTSEEVLETLRTRHPIVEKILEHRGLKNYWVHTSMPCPSLSIPKPDISTPPSIKPLPRPDD